jgi:hypothetical protein
MPKREFPSPAMDCSLWKVLPSLPSELPLAGEHSAGFELAFFRRSKLRSDSDDRYGLLSPSNNCRFVSILLAGYCISPTAKLHRDHCLLL